MAGPANTQFSVAVHVLTYLAGAGSGGRAISSDELAGSVNVSPVHIRKVLGPLRTAGLVSSRPGASGGWELARPARRIRLDEVWDLIHVAPTVVSHGPNPSCEVGRQVQAAITEIEADVTGAIRRRLHARTIADLAVVPATRPNGRSGAK